MKTGIFLSLAMLGVVLPLRAQYAVDWYGVNGGGGSSADGAITLTGTIGQPAAGTMSGGNYSIVGGFWGIISESATTAPKLSVSPTTTNTIVISWPAPSAGFVLEQNSNLGTVNWLPTLQNPTDDGTTKSVVVPVTFAKLFFRLKR